jgi:hypothetical protein
MIFVLLKTVSGIKPWRYCGDFGRAEAVPFQN